MQDLVNHPAHYTTHPSGIEAIEVTQFMSFTLGNAFKYLFRAEAKDGDRCYRKAVWYLAREIELRQSQQPRPTVNAHNAMRKIDAIVASEPRSEIGKAMRHIGKAAFQHTGTSNLECAIDEVKAWLIR
jgi:hypothetical protein